MLCFDLYVCCDCVFAIVCYLIVLVCLRFDVVFECICLLMFLVVFTLCFVYYDLFFNVLFITVDAFICFHFGFPCLLVLF